jgi:hypothetical protein
MALSMNQLAHPDQIRRMTSQTKYMVNDKLRYVLREERLAVSGVKAELQKRIIDGRWLMPLNSLPKIISQTSANPRAGRHRRKGCSRRLCWSQ